MGNSGSNCFIVIASGRTSISDGAGALRADNGSNNFEIREKVLKENCVLCLTSLDILNVKWRTSRVFPVPHTTDVTSRLNFDKGTGAQSQVPAEDEQGGGKRADATRQRALEADVSDKKGRLMLIRKNVISFSVHVRVT